MNVIIFFIPGYIVFFENLLGKKGERQINNSMHMLHFKGDHLKMSFKSQMFKIYFDAIYLRSST